MTVVKNSFIQFSNLYVSKLPELHQPRNKDGLEVMDKEHSLQYCLIQVLLQSANETLWKRYYSVNVKGE